MDYGGGLDEVLETGKLVRCRAGVAQNSRSAYHFFLT
jgi:hypothetical protein